MKKLALFLIGAVFLFILIGCSKEPKEPYLNLVYNGYTNTTILVEYNDSLTEKSYQGESGNNYLKIVQDDKLLYKSSKSIDKCTLLIQKADVKEKVKEITLDDNNVDTSIPQGKYIYTFSVYWENSSAKFIKLIEIE